MDSPAREPALVGAGAHTADQAGQHIRLGDSVGDVGRVGDDVPTAHPDTTPGGTAGHTPGGHAGAHLPSNDLNNPLRHGNGDTHSTGGNHPDTPSSADHTHGSERAGDHEAPAASREITGTAKGGSIQDGPSGGHPDDGRSGGGPAGADDASASAHGHEGQEENTPIGGGHDDGTPPPSDSNPGPGEKKPGLIRQDDNFTSEHNVKGQRKSHLNADGDLVPANPDGQASVVDHIVGRDPAKSDSPFTSLSSEGANAKAFGSNRIRVDLDRLEGDIAAGRVSGVEVYPPERVQGLIQEAADKIAGRPLDLTVPPGATKSQAEEIARSMGLSNTKAKRIAQRMIDMMNTRRDQEWLIKGVVPHEYIEGPFGG